MKRLVILSVVAVVVLTLGVAMSVRTGHQTTPWGALDTRIPMLAVPLHVV